MSNKQMNKTTSNVSANKEIFLGFFITILILTCVSIITSPEFIKDGLFIMAFIGIFYLIERKYPLPKWVVAVGLIPFILHICGVVLGFFELMFFGIGYDKYIHFFNSFAMVIVFTYLMLVHGHTGIPKKIIVALLMALGIGSLNEINEFVGTQYLGFTGPTMFSQGDSLPNIKHDFQTYDTWWDMIFNLLGTVAAAILIALIELARKPEDVI